MLPGVTQHMTCNPLWWPKIDLLATRLMRRVTVVFHEFLKIWLKLPRLFTILLSLLFKIASHFPKPFMPANLI